MPFDRLFSRGRFYCARCGCRPVGPLACICGRVWTREAPTRDVLVETAEGYEPTTQRGSEWVRRLEVVLRSDPGLAVDAIVERFGVTEREADLARRRVKAVRRAV